MNNTHAPKPPHLETLFSWQPPLVLSALDLDCLNKKIYLTYFPTLHITTNRIF